MLFFWKLYYDYYFPRKIDFLFFNFYLGFYFIPGALSIEEQCRWIKESLISFPQPPNRTNHNAFYGPIHDLFVAAKEKKFLVEEESSEDVDDVKEWKLVEEHQVSSRGKACKSVPASVLLRKLRWSTLGLQFDWSKAGHHFSIVSSSSFFS